MGFLLAHFLLTATKCSSFVDLDYVHWYSVLKLQLNLEQIESDLCVLSFEGVKRLAQTLDEASRKICWTGVLSDPSRSEGGLAALNQSCTPEVSEQVSP